MSLTEAFDLEPARKTLIAIVGSGGKTTLMYRLAKELADKGKKVVVTTSTKIFIPKEYPVLVTDNPEEIKEILERENIAVIGRAYKPDMLESPEPALFDEFKKIADFVLVEADGSRNKPLKAHKPNEPVIPNGADYVFAVLGFSAYGMELGKACHRPELAARTLGVDLSHRLTVEDIASIFMHPHGVTKNIPCKGCFVALINQSETHLQKAYQCADRILSMGAEKVIVAELKSQEPIKAIRTASI